jgi:hypothetical protein
MPEKNVGHFKARFLCYSQLITTNASFEVTNGYLKNDLDLIFTVRV